MGRKKVQMKGADSRRRSVSLKKASEVCTLCAVETALVIFSPDGKDFSSDGKAFSTGHPCVDAAIKKLVFPEQADSIAQQHEAEHKATLHELNQQYADAVRVLEAEKKRGENLRQMMKGKTPVEIMRRPVNDLNLQELQTLLAFMEDVQGKLRQRIGNRSVRTLDSTASTSANPAEATTPSADNPPGISPSVDSHGHGAEN